MSNEELAKEYAAAISRYIEGCTNLDHIRAAYIFVSTLCAGGVSHDLRTA